MRSRSAILLIALMFVVPVTIAWLFYMGVFQVAIESGTGKNKGELIHPAKPLGDFELQGSDGGVGTSDDFLGHWTMLEYAPPNCVEHCAKNIYKMRQIRLALGRNAYRVQRVIIADPVTDMYQLMEDNPGARLFRVTQQSWSMMAQFPDYIDGDISSIAERIYIIDPLGNLMMRYRKDVDPSDVLEDLRQLLKATWIRPRNTNPNG